MPWAQDLDAFLNVLDVLGLNLGKAGDGVVDLADHEEGAAGVDGLAGLAVVVGLLVLEAEVGGQAGRVLEILHGLVAL